MTVPETVVHLEVLVIMADVLDVPCPSGRLGFSPNLRAPLQGSPRLLIAGPLLTPDLTQKTSLHTQHQHLCCWALQQDHLSRHEEKNSGVQQRRARVFNTQTQPDIKRKKGGTLTPEQWWWWWWLGFGKEGG